MAKKDKSDTKKTAKGAGQAAGAGSNQRARAGAGAGSAGSSSSGAESGRSYELKSGAVDRLAGAEKDNVPAYSEEELNRYKKHRGKKIPTWLKVVLIKAWFAGAVCFFILWGLGVYLQNQIDMLFVLGMVMGLVTDLLVNPLLRFIEEQPGDNDCWMMHPKKGMGSFFLNIVHGYLVLALVFTAYNLVNLAIARASGQSDRVAIGVEPFLFGIFCMVFDVLLVGLRNMARSIVRDAKESARRG